MMIHSVLLPIVLSTLAVASASAAQNSSETAETTPAGPAAQEGSLQSDCIPRAALDVYLEQRDARFIDQFRAVEGPETPIVFFGSSIIQEGQWNGFWPDLPILNRGIGGDTITEMLRRLDETTSRNPSMMIIYAGGNDLVGDSATPEEAFDRLNQLIGRSLEEAPNAKIVLNTLFPREPESAKPIEQFNAMIMGADWPARVQVMDVHPWFVSETGAIKPEVANDGIHLSGAAYQRWADALEAYLKPEE